MNIVACIKFGSNLKNSTSAVGYYSYTNRSEGMEFAINLITRDNGDKQVIELSNATLTNIEGSQVEHADVTLTITRLGLAMVMTGKNRYKIRLQREKLKQKETLAF